jgi:hypothetical protein
MASLQEGMIVAADALVQTSHRHVVNRRFLLQFLPVMRKA